jgi:two-component system chemotaxis response regulator CheY
MAIKVLIIDDSAIVRQQVAGALAQASFDVIEAVDGNDAWRTIEAQRDIGMVLCDVNMPGMNGLELLKKLHDAGILPGLPVVILTTEGDPELIAKAKELGAKGWMVKPVAPSVLVATVRKLARNVP